MRPLGEKAIRKGPREAPSCRCSRFHVFRSLARLYFTSPWTPCPMAYGLYLGIASSVTCSALRCQTGDSLPVRLRFFDIGLTSFSIRLPFRFSLSHRSVSVSQNLQSAILGQLLFPKNGTGKANATRVFPDRKKSGSRHAISCAPQQAPKSWRTDI